MTKRELYAEIVKSGTWLYDGLIPSEIWIVRQNFEYHYEEGNGAKIGRGREKMSLSEAVHAAEEGTPGLIWDDHLLHKLNGGRLHSRIPTSNEK
jgi:hypothetical protein